MSKAKRKKRDGATLPETAAQKRAGLPAWIVPLAALIVAFVVFGPAVNGPFVLDDNYQLFGRPDVDSFSLRQWTNNVRPLLNVTFWANYQLSGTDTTSYHLFNVLLHWANAMLVWVLLRRLWTWAGGEGIWAPLTGAGLFLVHPVQTESVAYISSRSELLSIFFAYAALAIYLWRRDERPTILQAAAILICLGAAVSSKEHTAAMPAIFLLADYFWRTPFRFEGILRNWMVYVPMVLGGVYAGRMVMRALTSGNTAGFSVEGFTWQQYLFTQWRMFWRYLRLTVLPVGLNVDPDIAVSQTVLDNGAIVAAAGIAVLLGSAWWFRKQAPFAAFGLFAFALLLAPTSSFVPIQDVFAERRLYLPFLGVSCAAMEIFRRWKPPAWAPVAVLAVLAALTLQRSQVWANETALWETTVASSPDKYRPRFQLAYAYYVNQRCAEASQEYARAAELAPPDDDGVHLNWALSLDCEGKSQEALVRLREAASRRDTAVAHATIGMMYAKMGQLEEALRALDAAEKTNRRYAMTYVYRGNVRVLQGDPAQAEQEYRKALQLDPRHPSALAALNALRGM